MTLFLLTLFTLSGSADASSTQHESNFGSDVSVGYALAKLTGNGLSDDTHGSALFRLDTFVQNRTYEAPKLGLSVWGQMTVSPSPTRISIGELGAETEDEIDINHAGVSVVLRQPSAAPLTGTFGVGFGRMEVTTVTSERVALPAFTIEAGGRYKTSRHSFIDLMGRAHWATHQDPITQVSEDWWFLELAVMIGAHLR